MQILTRYIGSTLIKATLMVLLVMVGLEIFILLATQLNSIGKGSYTIGRALLYVFLTLPQQTYQLFPMAGLLGMLFGFSLLANHSELIIMRAAGISPGQILRCALKAGVLLIIVMTLLGEWIGPAAKYVAEHRKFMETSAGQALKTQQGLWFRQGNNFYHIATIYSPHAIAGVSQYIFDHQQLTQTSYAATGHYHHHAWEMHNVWQSTIHTNSVSAHFFPQENWYLSVDPYLLRISQSEPDEMSLRQLFHYINYQKTAHLSAGIYEINFWQRLFQPIASLIMMMLAIPFIFGPLRSTTTGLRLLMGTLVGLLFYILNQLFPPLSQVFAFPPYLAALLPIALFTIAGIVLLKRVR